MAIGFSFLKNIFNTLSEDRKIYYGAVIDSSDATLICIGTNRAGLLFLNESLLDTRYLPRISSTDETLRIFSADPSSYPEWSWDHARKTFKKTNPAIISDTMRERAVLSEKKARAVDVIRFHVNLMRSKISTGLWFQETIYAEKVRQARSVLGGGDDMHQLASAPYVAQYAEHSGVPLRQAAEEIIFQNQLDHDFLSKTEKIRLAFYKSIRQARSSDEIETCLKKFLEDGFV
ncbi:MAG: hypothetical protein RLZZ416_801 [Candidatus Parcubacteria bacterium]|jgi:hypothetical protein